VSWLLLPLLLLVAKEKILGGGAGPAVNGDQPVIPLLTLSDPLPDHRQERPTAWIALVPCVTYNGYSWQTCWPGFQHIP